MVVVLCLLSRFFLLLFFLPLLVVDDDVFVTVEELEVVAFFCDRFVVVEPSGDDDAVRAGCWCEEGTDDKAEDTKPSLTACSPGNTGACRMTEGFLERRVGEPLSVAVVVVVALVSAVGLWGIFNGGKPEACS